MLNLDSDRLDPQHMARDHLKAYQSLNKKYVEIIDESNVYNSKVKQNIEDIESNITSIFTQIPNLEKHNIKLNQTTNYYYHNASYSYFWDKFCRIDEYQLIVDDKVLGHYKLVYHVTTIAVGDKEDLENLKLFLENEKDNIISILDKLKSEREKITKKIEKYKNLFNNIVVNIQWNQPIKGKCGWEHGYWKKFQ